MERRTIRKYISREITSVETETDKSLFRLCCVLVKRGIQSDGPLKALYTTPLDRLVNSDTNLTFMRSIQPPCNYSAKTVNSPYTPQVLLIYAIFLNELGRSGDTCT